MTERASIGGRQVLDSLKALHALGIDLDAVCRGVGLDAAQLSDAVRVPNSVVAALWDEAERLSGDPLVGLHAGEHARPAGALSYLLLSSASLEEGLRRAARLFGIAVGTVRAEVEVRGDELVAAIDVGDGTLAANRHAVDYLLMSSLRSMQSARGDRLVPHEVHRRHADPGGREPERVFGCPVRFGQSEDQLVFSRRDLAAASSVASPLIAEQIEKFAAAILEGIAKDASVSSQVTAVLRTLLAAGVPADRAAVARRLGMSERSLQRALEGETTSFSELRDEVLVDLSKALLSNSSLKIEAIASSVGFGDGAAFSKAFARWTGCSPARYREQTALGQSR